MQRKKKGGKKVNFKIRLTQLNHILIFIFLILMAVLPIINYKRFFKISEFKKNTYYLFCYIAIIPTLISGSIIYLSSKYQKKKISLTNKFCYLFILSLVISAIFSSHKDYSLWGCPGWYMGLATQSLFILSYLLISKYFHSFKLNKLLIGLFFIVLSILSVCCILSRFHIDVFNMYLDSIETFWKTFIPFLGQSNWFASFWIVTIPLVWGVFLISQKKLTHFLTYPVLVLTSWALVLHDSDSIYVGALCVLLFLFLVYCKDILTFNKYLRLLAIFAISFLTLGIIQNQFMDRLVLHSDLSITVTSSFVAKIFWSVLIVLYGICESYIHFIKPKKEINEAGFIKLLKLIIIILAISAVILLISLIILVTSLREGFPLTQYLPANYFYFDGYWGTFRGCNWQMALLIFSEGNVFNYLFGYGPDTYYYYTVPHLDMLVGITAKLDNAHNELLSSLTNIGIVGTVAYYGLFVSSIKSAIKNAAKNPVVIIFAACLVGYMFNNLFSFMNIVSTPYIFIWMGIIEAYNSKENSNVTTK